ncbi:MAG: AraC family transcriptional regulator [Solitalea sp.]
MEATFTLKLPTSRSSDEASVNPHAYAIPYAESELFAGPQASIFMQSLERYNYCMELFLYEVKKRFTLKTVVDKPAVVFCYALSGRVRSLYQRSEKVPDLQAGLYAGYRLPAGEYRLQLPQGTHAFFYFALEKEYLASILQHLPHLSGLLNLPGRGSSDYQHLPLCRIDFGIRKVIKRMQHCSAGNYDLDLSLLSGVWDLLSIYEAQLQATKKFADRTSAEIAREVHAFIRQHFTETDQIQLRPIADRFRVAEKTLSRSFKNVFGISVHQLVIELRMERALTLLRESSYPITEVAARCGYPDIHRFSRAFKHYYRCSPSQAKNSKI